MLTLEGYDIVVFGASVPALRSEDSWNLSQTDIGLIGSITVIGQLIGALAASAVADRRGRRPTMIIAVAVFSAGMLVCAAAPSPEIFGAGRLVVGLGTGVLLPTTAAMVSEYALPSRRNFAQGLTFGGLGWGGAISALVTLGYGGHNFRGPFLIGALPAVVLVPVLLRWLPESVDYLAARGKLPQARAQLARLSVVGEILETTPPPGEHGAGSWRYLFDRGFGERTLLFWATTFMSLLILYGVYTWLPTLMTKVGYNIGSAIAFFLSLNVGMIIGALSTSWLADRFGRRRVLLIGYLTATASFVALAQMPPNVAAYVLVAVAGAGALSTQLLVNAYAAASYPTVARGTALGAMLGIGRLGGALGPIYVTWLLALPHASYGFYGFAVPAFLAGVFILIMPRPVHATRFQS